MPAKTLKGLIISPSFAYQALPDDGFVGAVNNVEKGMLNNAVLNAPPVPIPNLTAARETLTVAMAAAADGGKIATADKNKKRGDVAIMMRLLAHYVEVACKGDETTFLSSGFVPKQKPATPKPPTQLAVPTMVKVEQGPTGSLLAIIKPDPKALHFDVECAALGTNPTPGTPGPWTTIMVPDTKQPVTFDHLTPGTIYAFRVRAYGKLGLTDYSDTVQRMCI